MLSIFVHLPKLLLLLHHLFDLACLLGEGGHVEVVGLLQCWKDGIESIRVLIFDTIRHKDLLLLLFGTVYWISSSRCIILNSNQRGADCLLHGRLRLKDTARLRRADDRGRVILLKGWRRRLEEVGLARRVFGITVMQKLMGVVLNAVVHSQMAGINTVVQIDKGKIIFGCCCFVIEGSLIDSHARYLKRRLIGERIVIEL